MQDCNRCVLVLGGSFDPVHAGHIALAEKFSALLQADELRIVPAGNPWQKQGLEATAGQRVDMLELAFGENVQVQSQVPAQVPVVIDMQEVLRADHLQASYTVDTLQTLRKGLGEQCSIVFLIGADQLQNLHTWRRWQELFNYAHVCAASRPGFRLDQATVPHTVAQEFARRRGTPEQIRKSASGLTYLASDLDVDISATQIRAELKQGGDAAALVPPKVLDYIQQHHLYR